MVLPNVINASSTLRRSFLRELISLFLRILTTQVDTHNLRCNGPDDAGSKSKTVTASILWCIAVYLGADDRETLAEHVD
jgi:hypothetical protein